MCLFRICFGYACTCIKLQSGLSFRFSTDRKCMYSGQCRLDELDPNTFETRAAELLHGLGFPKHMMERKTKDMSGKT